MKKAGSEGYQTLPGVSCSYSLYRVQFFAECYLCALQVPEGPPADQARLVAQNVYSYFLERVQSKSEVNRKRYSVLKLVLPI